MNEEYFTQEPVSQSAPSEPAPAIRLAPIGILLGLVVLFAGVAAVYSSENRGHLQGYQPEITVSPLIQATDYELQSSPYPSFTDNYVPTSTPTYSSTLDSLAVDGYFSVIWNTSTENSARKIGEIFYQSEDQFVSGVSFRSYMNSGNVVVELWDANQGGSNPDEMRLLATGMLSSDETSSIPTITLFPSTSLMAGGRYAITFSSIGYTSATAVGYTTTNTNAQGFMISYSNAESSQNYTWNNLPAYDLVYQFR